MSTPQLLWAVKLRLGQPVSVNRELLSDLTIHGERNKVGLSSPNLTSDRKRTAQNLKVNSLHFKAFLCS